MIDHDAIHSNKRYKCTECYAVCLGDELDWFSDEPELIICPVCDNRVEFNEIE